jgi:hypothetical protein
MQLVDMFALRDLAQFSRGGLPVQQASWGGDRIGPAGRPTHDADVCKQRVGFQY